MDYKTKCQHDWNKKENKNVCSKCGKEILFLSQLNQDILIGERNNGRKYSVRVDKLKYFMPDDWNKFYNNLNEKNKLLFEFLICTGARIEEALCFHSNGLVDDQRKAIKLYVTKRKANKAGEQSGKPRTFQISALLYNKLKREPEGFIFIKADPNLSMNTTEGRETLKQITKNKSTVAYINLRNNLKAIGIEDYYNYSLHTIRKTHGMWLKALGTEMGEVCNRLGHDTNTYLKHYGSPSVFQPKDKQLMIRILGNINGM